MKAGAGWPTKDARPATDFDDGFDTAFGFARTVFFVAGFAASASLKRSDFGMTSYIPMVGNKVRLEVQAEGINIDRKERESLKRL